MGIRYEGFSVRDRTALEATVRDAIAALDKAHKQLIQLQKVPTTAPAYSNYRKWFGEPTKARLEKVTLYVVTMERCLNNADIVFKSGGPGCTVDTNAVATHFSSRPTLTIKQVLFDVTIKDLLQAGVLNITMCPRFFTLTQTSPAEQSQTGTFIHEMSHLFCGTRDVPMFDGHIAYGSARSIQLATTSPDSAIDNAENYGFFATT